MTPRRYLRLVKSDHPRPHPPTKGLDGAAGAHVLLQLWRLPPKEQWFVAHWIDQFVKLRGCAEGGAR
jgi:hypothetical protein